MSSVETPKRTSGRTPREFEVSHPWINFEIDLSRAPADLWMLLGEARSKCEHIEGVPLQPETARRLHQIYLVKGALATTAIEGNTLTEEQVREVIQGSLQLPPSQEYLAREVENIINTCNRIAADQLQHGPKPLTTAMIKEFNRDALQDLPLDEGVNPGEIRTHSVGVLGYKGAPARDCDYLLEKMCEWLNSEVFHPPGADEEARLVYAIAEAVMAHLYLAWIHPFGDGNGRAARLVEFTILLAAGVPFPAAHLLSNHYNQTRAEYYRQLAATSAPREGNVLPFMHYAVRGFVDGLRQQLLHIREEQLDVVWRDYVHAAFRDEHGASSERRRWLALDLSITGLPVPASGVRILSPRLAEAYSSKTSKTITRDLNSLEKMGLVESVRGGYRARRELILAFLPDKVVGETKP